MKTTVTKQKPLTFYQYETKRIYITWYNKVQNNYGMFKTAAEAMEVIKRDINSGQPATAYHIHTPEEVLTASDYLK